MARRFGGRISTVNVRAASIAYIEIPCATEQGRFLREQGILSAEQGAPERGHAARAYYCCAILSASSIEKMRNKA
jgi:hypothetical protein